MSFDIENTTVAQLALERPAIVPVFERWRIDYCCQGRAPLAEALHRAGVDPAELESVLSMLPVPSPNETRAELLGPTALADYIVSTHHDWTRSSLDRIMPLARKVGEVHGRRAPSLVIVRQQLERLHPELNGHMLREEQVLFPFIRQVEVAKEKGTRAPIPFFGTVRNPIKRMMDEHEVAAEILEQVIPILREELEDPKACTTMRLLASSVYELEVDLHAHVHLENNVLFPRAVEDEETAGTIDETLEGCSSETGCCGGH